jgi:hypothetical protein
VSPRTVPCTTGLLPYDIGQLLFKVAGSQNGSVGATFRTTGTDEIAGSVTSRRFCDQSGSCTAYVAVRLSRSFTAIGTWAVTRRQQYMLVARAWWSTAVKLPPEPLNSQ